MCIFCGKCVTSCPAKAKRTRNDVETVKNLFRKDVQVFASLAPSFPAEFNHCTPGQLAAAIKRLGFYAVSETALGADFVSDDIINALQARASGKSDAPGSSGGQKLFLSSACPAVVLYIKRYAPAFVPYLNDRSSPLLTHAAFLQKLYGKKTAVVFIGPCIAKKREADQFKEIAAALTFTELKQWFEQAGINPEEIPVDESREAGFVPRRAAKGAFFPIDGGMIISLQRKNAAFSQNSNMVISGIDNIAQVLSGSAFNNDCLETPLFLELLACSGGCVNGPCITRDDSVIRRRAQLLCYAESAGDAPGAENAGIPLTGTLTAKEMSTPVYPESKIRSVLADLGKYSATDELNCSTCGYETCLAFAHAMLEKRAEKTMCAAYTRSLAQKKANALIKAIPSGIVIVDKNIKIIECNRNFARLLGSEMEELYEIDPDLEGLDLRKIAGLGDYFEEAFLANAQAGFDYTVRYEDKIFHLGVYVIEKGETLCGVLEDITKPQIRQDKTVDWAQKIIKKNVKAVQQIAFLLGENAAETESILHTIIETHTAGGKKK
jgi:iron only hydrogenase large subunit-like protein